MADVHQSLPADDGRFGVIARTRWITAVLVLAVWATDCRAHGGGFPPPPATRGPWVPAATTSPRDPAWSGGAFPVFLPERRSWQAWWIEHGEPLLAARGGEASTLDTGVLSGRGRRVVSALKGASPEQVRDVVRAALQQGPELVAAAAVVALVRLTPETEAAATLGHVLTALAEPSTRVREAATVALAELAVIAPREDGGVDVVALLSALALDAARGRALLAGTSRVPDEVRARAVLGLGLRGDAEAVDVLVRVLSSTARDRYDLRACTLVALAASRDGGWQMASDAVLQCALDPTEPAAHRAVLFVALGRLGVPSAVRHLASSARDEAQPLAVRRAAVVGLGWSVVAVTGRGDPASWSALMELASDRDLPDELRGAAQVSLARRVAAGPVRSEQLDAFLLALTRELRTGRPPVARAWAALATGVAGRTRREVRGALTNVLRTRWRSSGDPAERGAFALALGLLGDTESAAGLLSHARRADDAGLRGHLAEALALLDHAGAAKVLAHWLEDPGAAGAVRLPASRALALLEGGAAVELLLAQLRGADSVRAAWYAGRGLGSAGPDAVAPLMHLVADPTEGTPARAFACLALAHIHRGQGGRRLEHLLVDTDGLPLIPTLEAVRDL